MSALFKRLRSSANLDEILHTAVPRTDDSHAAVQAGETENPRQALRQRTSEDIIETTMHQQKLSALPSAGTSGCVSPCSETSKLSSNPAQQQLDGFPSSDDEWNALCGAQRILETLAENRALVGSVRSRALRASLSNITRSSSTLLPDLTPDLSASSLLQEWDAGKSLPLASVLQLIEKLKAPGSFLPLGDLIRLIEEGSKRLKAEKAVEYIAVPSGGRVLVLGDTHGQLQDVLSIFARQGLPSWGNVYLFNGDVADRGGNAAEILSLILALKCHDHRCVFFNRGNHEDDYMNMEYGFHDECYEKYGPVGGHKVYSGFQALFNQLPLCSIVDSGCARSFVAHGGIPRCPGIRLKDIEAIQFRKEVPDTPGDNVHDAVFFDLLWSDPGPSPGLCANPRGQDVITFGPDMTKAFLVNNDLKYVIRSHEVPTTGRGFQWLHDGMLVTIFSGSNYRGCRNRGGVIAITHASTELLCIEHDVISLEAFAEDLERAGQEAAEKIRNVVTVPSVTPDDFERLREDVRTLVADLILRSKRDLLLWFTEQDPQSCFQILAATWIQGCKQVVNCSLPWELLLNTLRVETEPGSGRVNWLHFLQRFHVVSSQGLVWLKAVLWRTFDAILRSDLALKQSLAALDRDSNGYISCSEFRTLCADCGLVLSNKHCRAIRSLFAAHVKEQRGVGIYLFDFLDALTQACGRAASVSSSVRCNSWITTAVPAVSNALLGAIARPADCKPDPVSKRLYEWFVQTDSNGNGRLEIEELVAGLQKLQSALEDSGVPTDVASLREIAKHCDWDSRGTVTFFELLATMMPRGQLGEAFNRELAESVALSIYLQRSTLLQEIQKNFDPHGTGFVSVENFTETLRQLVLPAEGLDEDVQQYCLTHSQIELLAGELRSSRGIDYASFIRSFRVADALGNQILQH